MNDPDRTSKPGFGAARAADQPMRDGITETTKSLVMTAGGCRNARPQ